MGMTHPHTPRRKNPKHSVIVERSVLIQSVFLRHLFFLERGDFALQVFIGFVYDDDSRIPDLVERIVYNSTSGVSQASVFLAQNYGNVSREGLLCAVDAINNT